MPLYEKCKSRSRLLSAAPVMSMRWRTRLTSSWNRRIRVQPAKGQRDVHEEDPAPVQDLDEDPAEGRPDHRGDGPDTGHVALDGRALGQRVQVADDGHRGRHDGAGAQALQPRNTIRAGMLQAMPQRIEPSRNRLTPISMIGLRPNWSENLA